SRALYDQSAGNPTRAKATHTTPPAAREQKSASRFLTSRRILYPVSKRWQASQVRNERRRFIAASGASPGRLSMLTIPPDSRPEQRFRACNDRYIARLAISTCDRDGFPGHPTRIIRCEEDRGTGDVG